MAVISFDTYKFIEKLKSGDIPEKAAIAECEALQLALDSLADTSSLATKTDINGLKLELNTLELKLEQTKVDLIKWIAGLLLVQGTVIAALVKLLGG